MSEAVHWKLLTNPNYLGGCHFSDGKDKIVTIEKTAYEKVVGDKGRTEEKMVMHFKEDVKPLILNKTNPKIIAELFRSPMLSDWDNKKIQLYFDPSVKFGRDVVGGVRVRPFLPQIQSTDLVCCDCKDKILPASGLTAEQVAATTQKKYGRILCAECGAKAKAEAEKGKVEDVL